MTQIDVDALLNPLGPDLRKAAQGTPNEARVAVAVFWPQIEKALESGFTISSIYRVLSKAGAVGVTLRSFTRQVNARREGTRGSRGAAKQAGEARALLASEASSERAAVASAGLDASEQADKPAALPRRPWQVGPREAPDPNTVFKPRDPLADQ
jgi:hypothetical protein